MNCDPVIEEALIDLCIRRTAQRTTAADRVYLDGQVPQRAARPFVTVIVFSDVSEQSTDGPVGLSHCTVSFAAYAESQGEASQIARIIRKRLDNARGLYGGVWVDAVTHRDGRSERTTGTDGKEFSSLFGSVVEFEVSYRERVPIEAST